MHDKRLYIIAVLALLSAYNVLAYTVPQKIPVQGRLTNASTGVVLSGEYTFTFRIYNASTGGTLLWDENQTLTVDGNGLWNALLGNNTALSLNFSEDTYLEVELNHDGNPLPRVQLGSTPYAEWTDTASNLSCTDCLGVTEIEDIYLLNTGDNATGDYMFNGSFKIENSSGSSLLFVNSSNGNVGIGTTVPAQKLDIVTSSGDSLIRIYNGIRVGYLGVDSVNESFQIATDGDVKFKTGGSYTEVLRVTSSGNVGIGTTSPQNKLTISNAGGKGLEINPDFGGKTYMQAYDRTASTYSPFIIEANTTSIMIGNVGIGTTSPSAKLTVEGTGTTTSTTRSTSAAGWAASSVYTDGGTILMYSAGSTYGSPWSSSKGFYWGSGDANFFEGANARLTIKEGGNVGIGTTSPEVRFHVDAGSQTGGGCGDSATAIKITGSGDSSSLYGGIVWNISGTTRDNIEDFGIYAWTSAGLDKLSLTYNQSSKIVVLDNGNVGIGTTSPDHDLEIGSGTYSEIDAGEAQFTTGSSRTYKENINPVKVEDILDKIKDVPVNTYDFREEYCNGTDDKCKDKMGLIAEDFYTIFGRGSDKELSGQEVQMALWLAVQELKEENDLKDAEIEALKVLVCLDHPDAGVCVSGS